MSRLPSPTRLAWAPDGRLFVGDLRGRIVALSFDENWNETARTEVASLLGTQSDAILGLAFDPTDESLLVAHNRIGAGGCADEPWPFRGRISRLRPPGYDQWETVVSGLPNGKTTHGVNDLLFLPDGDLLVSVGGVTNAGVPSCNMGSIPESPLSAAVLRIRLHAADFDGEIRWRTLEGDLPADDQRMGGAIHVAGDRWGSVEATGFRNPFGMERTRGGRVYVLDNGPNVGDGEALHGDDTRPIGSHPDELNLLEPGGYYGHPNPARGERFYFDSLCEPSADFHQALRTLPASTNGIVHFRSELPGFENVLVLQQFDGDSFVLGLDESELPVAAPKKLSDEFPCLDIVQGPGDTLLGTDFHGGRILLARPRSVAREPASI